MSEKVELRGDISRDITDVLDAVAKAKRVSRMEMVERVLREWAEEKVHESMMVQRITRGNGIGREP